MTLFKSDNCLTIRLSKFSASATYNQACVLASLATTVVLTIIDLSVICLQPKATITLRLVSEFSFPEFGHLDFYYPEKQEIRHVQ